MAGLRGGWGGGGGGHHGPIAAATSAEGKKKKVKRTRVETYSSYLHKVLKQVHPGE
jgi:hypothetical protein